MTKLLLPFIVLLAISCNRGRYPESHHNADTVTVIKEPTAPQEPEPLPDSIASIRQKVERINTLPLEKKHVEFICDEQTMVDYFYYNGEIVKIAVDFGTVGDVYAKEGYYYDAGQLIFVYEFVEGGPACEGCLKTNEYRSYIRDNKTIRYVKDSTTQQCRKCEFLPSSRQYKLLQAKTAEQVKVILCR